MTYGYTLAKCLGLAGLAVAMAGCPSGDDGETQATSFNPPTTSVGMTDDSTSEGSTSTPMTSTGQESTDGADSTTSGGVTCDPPCDAGQECIAGECFGMPGDSTTGDPPATNSDYGPCGMCAAGEMPVSITGIEGCFCSPACDGAGSMCATPNEGTAQAMCVLELMMGAGPTQCALICMNTEDCPTGATCEDAGGGSLCVHPAP
jgi:hypothetical protein